METPSIEIFNEMRAAATQIWNTYDNQFGYVTEKLNRINSLENIQDNAMVFYRIFDWENQAKLVPNISKDHSGNTFGGSCNLAYHFLKSLE
jgi:hypothetical protein